MQQRPRNSQKGIFTKPLVTLMCVGGLWSTLVNLTVFIGAQQLGYSLTQAMTFTFVTLVLIQFLKAYNFRSIQGSVLHRPWANRWLNLAVAWELILLGIVVHWSVLQSPFGTTDISTKEWGIALALSATIVPVLELSKFWLKRKTH